VKKAATARKVYIQEATQEGIPITEKHPGPRQGQVPEGKSPGLSTWGQDSLPKHRDTRGGQQTEGTIPEKHIRANKPRVDKGGISSEPKTKDETGIAVQISSCRAHARKAAEGARRGDRETTNKRALREKSPDENPRIHRGIYATGKPRRNARKYRGKLTNITVWHRLARTPEASRETTRRDR